MESVDLAVRNLFQEFQEIVLKRTALERDLRVEGTVTRKKVKGKEYWYQQHTLKGQAVQDYIGPITAKSDKEITAIRKNQKERKNQIRQLIFQERKKITIFRKAGFPVLDSLTSSLIEKLSQWNLVFNRGVLVGSHAFAAYSGMLGHFFDKESLKTLDIDVVHDRSTRSEDSPIEIVQPEGFIAIQGRNFYSVPELSHKTLPSSFVGPGGLRIDFLTPLRGRPGKRVSFPNLPFIGAQPLHFLDFLIKGPTVAVLMGPRGGIPVTVPDPARYAIHKLIVAARRPASENTKRLKDRAQASQLITTCAEERPEELQRVYKEALGRGKGWKSAISDSLHRLPPEISRLLTG
ncbi:MAG: hypothetical protein HYS22_01440 [Deltaproteobacteria bacterium]|nr:hypothetical protein [Deltaproteobacteria bacterium]